MLNSKHITTEMLMARLRAAEKENAALKGEKIKGDSPEHTKNQLTWMGANISEAQRAAIVANHSRKPNRHSKEHSSEAGNMLAIVARIHNLREENSKFKA